MKYGLPSSPAIRNTGNPFFLLPAMVAALVALSCNRDFESPYLPGNPDYVGNEWSHDADGDGVADSVEKYAPGCGLPPNECLTQARQASQIIRNPLTGIRVRDMALKPGGPEEAPQIEWFPPDAWDKSYVLETEDSSIAAIVGSRIRPAGIGSTWIILIAGKGEVTTRFLVSIDTVSLPGQAFSARDLALVLGGGEIPPVLTWPLGTTDSSYSLESFDPKIVAITGRKLVGVDTGSTHVTARTMDGKSAVFSVIVSNFNLPNVPVDSLYASDIYLPVGSQDGTPNLTWYPSTAGNRNYALESLDPEIASVLDNRIHAIKAGTASMAVTTADGGKKAAFKVFIIQLDSSVMVDSIRAADMTFALGDPAKDPQITWYPSNAGNQSYTMESDRPDIAAIVSGQVSVLKAGTARITVTSAEGNKQTFFTVAVTVPVNSISVGPMTLTVGDPDKPPFPVFSPSNANNQAFSLSSSNSLVATVIAGKVHAVAAGTSIVTVRALDGSGVQTTFTVTVTAQTTLVESLSAQNMSMVAGSSDQTPAVIVSPTTATNKSYSLSSGNTAAATIVSGKVHAVATGAATVTVKALDGSAKQTTFTVTVTAAPILVQSITASNMSITVGNYDKTPIISVSPATASNKSYSLSSGNTAAATIVSGKVHAVAAGAATVTVKALDGSSKQTTFTVTVAAAPILVQSITASNMSITVGDADKTPTISVLPSNATNRSYSLSSGNTSAATIVSGKVHAVAAGAATVTVKALDGSAKQTTFTVTVSPLIIKATALSTPDMTLNIGDPDKSPVITWTPSNPTNKNYSMESGNTAVSTIVSNKVHAVSGGSATITLTSTDGPKTTFKVTVPIRVISVSVEEMRMVLGDITPPPITWNPTNSTNQNYTLTDFDATILKVVDGKLQALGHGSTTVTLTTQDGGKTATFKVTVRKGGVVDPTKE